MDCEALLREALVKFGSCHVLGSESRIYYEAMKNLQTVIRAVEIEKEREKHADSDKQREGV